MLKKEPWKCGIDFKKGRDPNLYGAFGEDPSVSIRNYFSMVYKI